MSTSMFCRRAVVVYLTVALALLAACSAERSEPAAGSVPDTGADSRSPDTGPEHPPAETGTSQRGSPSTVEPSATAGAHDGDASACWSSDPVGGEGIALSDATEASGLIEPLTGMYGHAAAVADVTGNGWPDLFVAGFADRPADHYQVRGASGPSPDRLLLGGPDGFVVDPTFPGQLARTSGAVFADLDGDGRLEIVAVRNPRGDTEISRRPTVVYEQTDTGWAVVSTLLPDVAGRAVAAVDIDRDGLLDLVIVADRWGGGSTRLLRNVGGLQFEDATTEWGVPGDMTGLALATVDLDGSGWIDIVVSGDERVLMGGPDGFRVERHSVLDWEEFGNEDDAAGIAVGDLDGDGRPDLVIGQHFNSTLDFDERVPVRVFLNRTDDDGLRLVDVTEESGSPGLWTKSPHVAVVDLDNDGRPDIVTSAATSDGVPLILLGTDVGDDGIPKFTMSGEAGDGHYWVTGAEFDVDRDGRIDLFQVEWDPALASPLFNNISGSGRWLQVEFAGSEGAAAGTRVRARDPGTGGVLASAWVASSTGYAAGAPTFVHLGLGAGPDDASVEVEVSPVGGDTTTYSVPVNARVRWDGC